MENRASLGGARVSVIPREGGGGGRGERMGGLVSVKALVSKGLVGKEGACG